MCYGLSHYFCHLNRNYNHINNAFDMICETHFFFFFDGVVFALFSKSFRMWVTHRKCNKSLELLKKMFFVNIREGKFSIAVKLKCIVALLGD